MEARPAALGQRSLHDPEAARTTGSGRARRRRRLRRPGGPTGSIEEGLKAADVRLKQSYTIAYIAHAPLEPRAAVAKWEDGKLTVWTGSQGPFRVRGELTGGLRVSDNAVRVIVPDTGSGYGGKHTVEAAVEAARLAREAGRPVKVVWTREEEFTWAYFRPAGVIDVVSGVKQGWDAHRLGIPQLQLRWRGSAPLMRCPIRSAASTRRIAPLRQGSYRALAATANHFARESHMDELAHAVQTRPAGLPAEEPQARAAARAVPRGLCQGVRLGPEEPARIGGSASRPGWIRAATSPPAPKCPSIAPAVACKSYVPSAPSIAGPIINPDHLKNQVEGAMIMGLGGAMTEAIAFEDGKILNPKFSKYRVPRFRDAPEIEVVLLDRKDLPSAGAGETPIVGIAPAVGNAIFDAVGIRLRSMPMVPQGLKL